MSKLLKHSTLASIVILVLIGLTTTVYCKEKKAKIWKLTAQIPYGPTSKSTAVCWSFLDDIEQRTGGRVTFPKRFTKSALVPSPRALPAVAEGTIHFFHTSPLFHANVDHALEFLEVPGLFLTRKVRANVVADPEIMGIMQEAWEKQGVHLVGFQCIAEQTWSFNKELKSIDDMRGLRIIGSGGTFNNLVEALGASTVTVAPPERYEALARGVANGVAGCIYMLDSYKYGESCVQLMLPPWIEYQSNPWLVTKTLWDSFPDDIKAAIEKAGKRLYETSMDKYEKTLKARENFDVISKYNLKVLFLSKEDLAKLNKAFHVVANNYARHSPECRKMMDIWQAKYAKIGMQGWVESWSKYGKLAK